MKCLGGKITWRACLTRFPVGKIRRTMCVDAGSEDFIRIMFEILGIPSDTEVYMTPDGLLSPSLEIRVQQNPHPSWIHCPNSRSPLQQEPTQHIM